MWKSLRSLFLCLLICSAIAWALQTLSHHGADLKALMLSMGAWLEAHRSAVLWTWGITVPAVAIWAIREMNAAQPATTQAKCIFALVHTGAWFGLGLLWAVASLLAQAPSAVPLTEGSTSGSSLVVLSWFAALVIVLQVREALGSPAPTR
jgi:hypothetical protein